MSCQRCMELVCQCQRPRVVYNLGQSADDMRGLIRDHIKGTTQKAFAADCDVSESFLSDVLSGRREPTGRLLEAIGWERVVTYRPIAKDTPP